METQNPHQSAARLKVALLTVLAATIGWFALLSYQLDGPTIPLVLAAVLAGCFKWLLSKPWGKDLTWSDGRWVDTDPMAVRAGALTPYAAPLMYWRRSVMVGVCVAGALSALAIAGKLGTLYIVLEQPQKGDDLVELVLLAGFLCMAAYFGASIYTRRVQFDDAGLCDANFFRSQRVPWNAVLGLMSPDAIAKREADRESEWESESGYGARSHHGANLDSTLDQQCWVLMGQKGDRILRLRYNMVPQESLAALLKRIESRISARGEGRL